MSNPSSPSLCNAAVREQDGAASNRRPTATARALDTLGLVFAQGGPGFCQFALNNACNAACGFCNFARDKLTRDQWHFVDRADGLRAIEILYERGMRYLVFTGGEPLLHPDFMAFLDRATILGMKSMLVTNGSLLRARRIRELVDGGLSSFIISVDAASRELHEQNRGLRGVCERIRRANEVICGLGRHATASVTMSRLVDYDSLPEFLDSLGFGSVTFSYPVTELGSNFLGFSDSDLVNYTKEELLAEFEKVKRLKKRLLVVNPTPSIEDMARALRGEQQRYACLGGFRYFYLDWDLMLWRCHHWQEPMCSIFDFDGSQCVRDGCTACMIDCYRDSSVMQHVGVSAHDAWQSLQRGKLLEAARAALRPTNVGSLRAVLQELPWLLRF